jgi:predicted RNA binding protein YcfA (HicA-like mRNA interferase family)
MTRLPRDISGERLIRVLATLGYTVTRQTGSHVRLTTVEGGEHHVTVPRHAELRVGTLGDVLNDVAWHLGISRDSLIESLFK